MWDLWIYFSLLALNLLVWLLRFQHYAIVLRLLGAALLLTFLLEGYSAFLMLRQIRNLHIYQFLAPAQYVLFAVTLGFMIRGPGWQKAIAYSIPFYLLAVPLLTQWPQAPEEFNSYALALKHLLLTLWSLVYFWEVFQDLAVSSLEREPTFWIATGVLFHALGSFFNDGLMNTMLGESLEAAYTFYFIGIFLSFLLYLMTLVAFLLPGRKRSLD